MRLGIIGASDEQPYIDVRPGRRAIEPIAARLGLEVDTLRRRVERIDTRIDTRIANGLAAGLLTETASPHVRQDLARQARRRQRIRAGRAHSRPATSSQAAPAAA